MDLSLLKYQKPFSKSSQAKSRPHQHNKKLFKLPNDNFHNIVVLTGDAEFKTDPGPCVIQLFKLPKFLS